MANSLSFDGNDMADYNLVVSSPGDNLFGQVISHVQLQDKGYAFRPQREPRRLPVNFHVTGTSRSNLDSNLDNIKRLLTTLTVQQLIFDSLSTRYFYAILEKMDGKYTSSIHFVGTLNFICPDPLSYSTTETTSTHAIDADPKTIEEIVGGSGWVMPVYVLTAGEDLAGITLLINNLTTLEELSIASLTIADTEVLTIDTALWTVTLEDTVTMANVTGKFPRLEPNLTNSIKITAFGSLGSMDIIYRDAYL